MPELTYKRLTPETWTDFEALFLKHHGVRGGCWCVYYLMRSTDFGKKTTEERREYHKQLVLQGKTMGIIVYSQGQPVGWCQFAPAEILVEYDHNRIYSKLDIAPEDKPGYRISCVFTDRDCRRRGVAKYAIQCALSEIARLGGGVVEVFPYDCDDKTKRRFDFNGSVEYYEELGFKKIVMIGKSSVLMRKRVMPLE